MRHRRRGGRHHQARNFTQKKRHEELREGVVQHHGSFGFLIAEGEGESDVFLRGPGLALAMDGDRVQARVRKEGKDRWKGEVVKVVERSRASIVGVLKKMQHGWAVVPPKGEAPPARVTDFAHGVEPLEGCFAVARINRWPTATAPAAGTVTELVGSSEDLNARITVLLRARGFSETFPKAVLAQSEVLPENLEPAQWQGREKLFDMPVMTIDGIDARDFDDAVSLEPLAGGAVRLGVHIADVSHYVKPGSPLDKEAYARATSVYLPDRVVPMLPPSLSNNLCSLVPHRERLTVSVFMDIDSSGTVRARRIANTVIKSCHRFTYEEAQTILDGGSVSTVPRAAAEAVIRMGELSGLLTRVRFKRGSLDFDLPEYKIEVDARGKPVRVSLRSRLQSHRLIEEFMLLANEAIATELMAAHRPFLHRRHDEPAPEKIKALAKMLGQMGLSAAHITGGNTHKALQDVLRQAEGHPLEELINSLIVRSMKQAVYAPESSGHFGIATRAYAHFTSPIRRYPDLMAHRAVKALLKGVKEDHGALPLAAAGLHCSERERAAAECEYKSVDLMRAELFRDLVGETMEGVVTNVIERGSFVLFPETGAEGMLRVTNLAPGTKVKVTIDAVDPAEGKIDLSLAERPSAQPVFRGKSLRREKSGRKHRRRR